MSNIYMLKKEISFGGLPQYRDVRNRLSRQDIFVFPSNVIQCSLTITNLDALRCSISSLGVQTQKAGTLGFFGAGVEGVSYIGPQVHFSAWLKFLQIDNDGDSNVSVASDCSFLAIQAIAQCE